MQKKEKNGGNNCVGKSRMATTESISYFQKKKKKKKKKKKGKTKGERSRGRNNGGGMKVKRGGSFL